jgi:hypothetical protein
MSGKLTRLVQQYTCAHLGPRFTQLLVSRVPSTALQEQSLDVDALIGGVSVVMVVHVKHDKIPANLRR